MQHCLGSCTWEPFFGTLLPKPETLSGALLPKLAFGTCCLEPPCSLFFRDFAWKPALLGNLAWKPCCSETSLRQTLSGNLLLATWSDKTSASNLLGNLFSGALLANLFLQTCSWEPCLRVDWELVYRNLAWEPVPRNLSWESVLV